MPKNSFNGLRPTIEGVTILIEKLKAILEVYKGANLKFAQAIYDNGFENKLTEIDGMGYYGKHFAATITNIENHISWLIESRVFLQEKALLQHTPEWLN